MLIGRGSSPSFHDTDTDKDRERLDTKDSVLHLDRKGQSPSANNT